MKIKLIQSLLCSLLVTGLLLAPLPGLGDASVSAAGLTTKAAAVNTQHLQVFVDGKKLSLSAPAFAEKGVTFVPMRDIFKALGATVTWDSKTESFIGRKGNISISLKVGNKEAVVNGKTLKLAAPAVERSGVTFVPVHFIADSLRASVKWDSAANAVRITSLEAAEQAEYEKWLEAQKKMPKFTSTEIVNKYDKSIVLIMTNRGQGSGIVIGDQLILTNHHVMANTTSATALSIKGDELKISGVVNYDAKTDLAIVKTEKPITLPAVEVGYGLNSHKGDKVVAIGSPLGLQNTVSDGLISNILNEGGVRYIQTSTPIDRGSSGGALFNEFGELIGITTSGISNTNADLNFAVSVMHAAALKGATTDAQVKDAKFPPSNLLGTLVGAPLTDIQKLMAQQYSSLQTTEGTASFTKWNVKRDSDGWLILTADIDPLFYMYYGPLTAKELRIWSINLGHELHRLLPDERIQVLISFEREYGFEPRGFEADEVTSIGNNKWRVRYPVIDMQLKDQLHIKVRN
ncbi:stalk domain-containing protein [Bacillus sp. FJAT-28004]|uniref:stalk domain-containing protein n=1 Tax=Bacillus sp. FJAT-28004 TaxID=1679165 RepID=UPI0006B5F5C1|nr:stalk domain-containing protein [Bacillus sp. FJAT-28004]